MATRRSREQWQALVDEQAASGLSAAQFCERHGIGYASFCNWRKRLSSTESPEPTPGASRSEDRSPGFVDLSSFTGSASGDEQGAGGGAWTIVLSLGNGVELTLSQAG